MNAIGSSLLIIIFLFLVILTAFFLTKPKCVVNENPSNKSKKFNLNLAIFYSLDIALLGGLLFFLTTRNSLNKSSDFNSKEDPKIQKFTYA